MYAFKASTLLALAAAAHLLVPTMAKPLAVRMSGEICHEDEYGIGDSDTCSPSSGSVPGTTNSGCGAKAGIIFNPGDNCDATPLDKALYAIGWCNGGWKDGRNVECSDDGAATKITFSDGSSTGACRAIGMCSSTHTDGIASQYNTIRYCCKRPEQVVGFSVGLLGGGFSGKRDSE